MSGREWAPGAVALIEVGCQANRHRATFAGKGWRYGGDRWVDNDPAIVTILRPLLVLDPESDDDARRLMRAFWAHGNDDCDDEQAMRDAMRSLVAPPKPEEPTGLGAVVIDDQGQQWVAIGDAGDRRSGSLRWREALGTHVGETATWRGINAVRVLSEGVAS
jgi:hypothetical protein